MSNKNEMAASVVVLFFLEEVTVTREEMCKAKAYKLNNFSNFTQFFFSLDMHCHEFTSLVGLENH